MGEIAAIWIKRFKRGPMDAADHAELIAGSGIVGNADRRGGKRQVTVIDEAAWRRATDPLGGLDPTMRRANVMLRGVELANSRGMFLRLGACVIRVYGEVTPCRKMDEARQGLRAALRPNWAGGVFGEIVEGGTIRVGDPADWD